MNNVNPIYASIEALCDLYDIRPGRMCRDTGLSSGNIADLKFGRIQSISYKNMKKIADYFAVEVGLLESGGPFEYNPNAPAVTIRLPKKHSAEQAYVQPLLQPLDDDSLISYIDELRNRPQMKMLFKASKGATEEQLKAVVAMLEYMKTQDSKSDKEEGEEDI